MSLLGPFSPFSLWGLKLLCAGASFSQGSWIPEGIRTSSSADGIECRCKKTLTFVP